MRLSDFKSDEYVTLIGGDLFEPKEENPMIGFRGAFRYPSKMFQDCFALECQALIKVREDMGLDNVDIMIPFVRSVDEGKKTLQLMADNGLVRGRNKLKLYLMCEIPDRKSTRLNSSHRCISYAVFCLKKKKSKMNCAR